MADRDTGFHRLDADWTAGRRAALSHAETIARRQMGRLRKVQIIKREG